MKSSFFTHEEKKKCIITGMERRQIEMTEEKNKGSEGDQGKRKKREEKEEERGMKRKREQREADA